MLRYVSDLTSMKFMYNRITKRSTTFYETLKYYGTIAILTYISIFLTRIIDIDITKFVQMIIFVIADVEFPTRCRNNGGCLLHNSFS